MHSTVVSISCVLWSPHHPKGWVDPVDFVAACNSDFGIIGKRQEHREESRSGNSCSLCFGRKWHHNRLHNFLHLGPGSQPKLPKGHVNLCPRDVGSLPCALALILHPFSAFSFEKPRVPANGIHSLLARRRILGGHCHLTGQHWIISAFLILPGNDDYGLSHPAWGNVGGELEGKSPSMWQEGQAWIIGCQDWVFHCGQDQPV